MGQVKVIPLKLGTTVTPGDTIQDWGFVEPKPRLDPQIEHLVAMSNAYNKSCQNSSKDGRDGL